MPSPLSPGKPAKHSEGPNLSSSGEKHAIDERSLEEAIRRCCHKFSLQLIDEIRVSMCRRERESSTPPREKKEVRSLSGDRPSPAMPLGDTDATADAGPENDDDDDDDGTEPDRFSSADRFTSAAYLEESKSTSCFDDEGRRSTLRSRRSSHFPGMDSDQRLSGLRHEEQTKEIAGVLKAARLSRLPRQSLQLSDINMPFHYFCCGKVLCTRRGNIVHEDTLDFVMGVLVIANMIQLGLSADYERDWDGWLVVDSLFAVAFLIEFILKCLIRGIYEHFIVHCKGTLFDGIIVLAALVELVSTMSGKAKLGSGAQSLTVLRVVRLLRLVRIVKALRLPMFKDLMMMCEGLVGGSQTLFCSIILLMVPIYAAALMLRELVGTDETNEEVVRPFTSLPWSFFTTFRCIMGDCVAESGQPLPELLVQKIKFGWLFGVIYMLLILVTFLGVFNVIIAIYVEQIVVSARKNESLQRRRRLGDVKRMDLLLANLVHEFVKAKISDDKDSVIFGQSMTNRSSASVDMPQFQDLDAEEVARIFITKKVFEETINTEHVQNMLEQLGIPSEDRWNLFDILDADGTGSLHLGEIVEGFKKLRGEPRRSDVVANGLSIRAMQKRVHMETQSIFTIARKIAINVECIIQDHAEDTEIILNRFDKLTECLGDVAKVPSTPGALNRKTS